MGILYSESWLLKVFHTLRSTPILNIVDIRSSFRSDYEMLIKTELLGGMGGQLFLVILFVEYMLADLYSF